MAAVAAARPLLHGFAAALPSRSPPLHPSPSPPPPILHLHPKNPLRAHLLLSPLHPLTPSPPRSRLLSVSAAAFSETEDEHEHEHERGEEEEEEEEEEEDHRQSLRSRPRSYRPDEAGRLYVGNLPYSLTAPQLAELFSQAGTVESVEIVYDRVTDRSRGFAFVTMGSAEEASEAIRMFDGSQVGGRTVKVNFPEVPRGGEREVMGPRARGSSRSRGYVDSPYKVYAGNLGWGVTSEALREAFADQPGILGAKVIYELGTGRSRGYGFISFASSEDARSAIDTMNGKEVEGRPLRLNIASERPSAVGAAPSPSPSEVSETETANSPSSSFQSSFT